ncbi:hypothetical protein A8V01_11145 [Novosphingobium guangzhouense]|uniref:Uncharacterized protein n=2 Tax=Novosphingobium guangzhouense TaxID=1850347 RepID=A0A2K2FTF3_9SPHN|nr:hypothetical protein A8V01_11145 [Novosphingobium guangzhouense]
MRVLALSLVAGSLMAGVTAPVLADDPRDPAMTPEAIARDAATIRRMNREQLDYVQKRDAGYAQGWRDYDAARGRHDADADRYDDEGHGDSGYAADRRDYEAARADYAEERRRYDREMREWRQDVSACRAGYYERCVR